MQSFKEFLAESAGNLEAAQNLLADHDIDSLVVGSSLKVPTESLSKAKELIKKLDKDIKVIPGLHS
jgi:hypothetical protein